MTTTGPVAVLITTFLASGVEAIEMVTIVIGVGATRGWRSTWIGSAAGFAVLAVVIAVDGVALRYDARRSETAGDHSETALDDYTRERANLLDELGSSVAFA